VNLHHLAEERSLAYHRLVADRLLSTPSLVEQARARVQGWLEEQRSAFYAQKWLQLLDGPLEELVDLLRDPKEEARALRQATPFAGLLAPKERWALWRQVRKRLER
jgi:hypothetical protein